MSEGLEIKVDRGAQSWAYFPLAYNILLTITLSVIAVIPIGGWAVKVVTMLVMACVLFRLCFYNDTFRNKIVGIFNKTQRHQEVFHK